MIKFERHTLKTLIFFFFKKNKKKEIQKRNIYIILHINLLFLYRIKYCYKLVQKNGLIVDIICI